MTFWIWVTRLRLFQTGGYQLSHGTSSEMQKSFEKPKSNLKRWSKQLSQQAPQSINSCSSFTWLFCLCYPIKIPNPMDNPRVSSLLLPWHITCQWPSGPYDHGIQVYRILGSCITVNNCLEVHPKILTRPQTIHWHLPVWGTIFPDKFLHCQWYASSIIHPSHLQR